MPLTCPKCSARFSEEDVNEPAGLAKCVNCDEIYRLSELPGAAEKQALNPPAQTRIRFAGEPDGTRVLEIPRRWFTPIDLPMIAFALFWVIFLAFWTATAANVSIIFGLFSLPFWLVGLGMWHALIGAAVERQRIELRPEAVTIRKRGLRRRATVAPCEDISAVGYVPYNPINPMAMQVARGQRWAGGFTAGGFGSETNAPQSEPLVPGVTHGTERTAFGEFTSEAEQRWLIAVLKAHVEARTGRAV